jgi:subtilase family serine protease
MIDGSSAPSGFTPQQIQAAYGIDSVVFGTIKGDGTGQTIAIVDAFDDPDLVNESASGFASSDLARFDQQFNLSAPPSFIKLSEGGASTGLPGTDPLGKWELEEALDVEWAHAIAPGAGIVLIECNSASGQDMYQGVQTAAGLPGVSVVSMSWGASEFAGESSFDHCFVTPAGHQGVTFMASTGDGGSPGEYPAYSPNVVAVGGTSLTLAPGNGYGSEQGWSGSGGGTSAYESEPSYQSAVQNTGKRTTPDVAFDADPNTGVAVYDSYDDTGGTPWQQVGGTSLGAPSWAGLFAIADQGRVAAGASTLNGASQSLPALYALSSSDFHDITSGGNGRYSAGPGYDEVTGLGSPIGNLLVVDLAQSNLPGRLVVTMQPPGNVTAGNGFGLSVSVEDTSGHVETSFNGPVSVAIAASPTGAPLGGVLTVNARGGVASFSGLTITGAGTGYTLAATAGGSATVTTSVFNVTPAVASRLVLTADPPASVVVGGAFGLIVAVEDAYGNVETKVTGSVAVSLARNPDNAALSGTLTVPVTQGLAAFTNLSLNKAGRNYSLRLSLAGLTPAQMSVFRVVAPAASRSLTIRAKPSHRGVEPSAHAFDRSALRQAAIERASRTR